MKTFCHCNNHYGLENSSIILFMQNIQRNCGYLPEDELKRLADNTGTPLMDIYSIATFYKSFKLEPQGEHTITVCTGTACHLRGSGEVFEEMAAVLGVGSGGGTSEDGKYTLEKVNCLGACALAPLIVIDGHYHGNVTPGKAREMIEEHYK